MSRRRVLSIITTSTTTPEATTTPKPTRSKPATCLKAGLATTLICAALLSLPVQEAMASGASAGDRQQAMASGATGGHEQAASPAKKPAPASEASPRTDVSVETDPDVIRVFVGGKEIATFDAAGLHVNGDITFTGKSGGGKP